MSVPYGVAVTERGQEVVAFGCCEPLGEQGPGLRAGNTQVLSPKTLPDRMGPALGCWSFLTGARPGFFC